MTTPFMTGTRVWFASAIVCTLLLTAGNIRADSKPGPSEYRLMYVKVGTTPHSYVDLEKMEQELNAVRQALASAGDAGQQEALTSRVAALEGALLRERSLRQTESLAFRKREEALARETETWREAYTSLEVAQNGLLKEIENKKNQLARHIKAENTWDEERSRLLDRFQREGLVRRGKTLRESIDQADNTALVWSLNDVGLLLLSEGRLPESEELFRRALVVLDATVGRSDIATGTILEHLADVCVQKQDLDAALSFYREAEGVYRSVLGKNHPRYANILNSRANAMRDRQPGDAEVLYREAARIYAGRGKRYVADQAVPVHNLGLLLMEQGRMDEAGALLEQAVDLITSKRNASSANAVMAYRSLSRYYLAAGNPEKAAACETRINEVLLSDMMP